MLRLLAHGLIDSIVEVKYDFSIFLSGAAGAMVTEIARHAPGETFTAYAKRFREVDKNGRSRRF